jgi:hypothetical protein
MNMRDTEPDGTVLRQAVLRQAMLSLAAEHRAGMAPMSVERAVLAEFEASRRRRRRGIAAASAAIAAMFIAGVVAVRERPAQHQAVLEKVAPPPTQLGKAGRVSEQGSAPAAMRKAKARPRKRPVVEHETRSEESAEEPFVAIPYTTPLAPEERATVVRIRLSPSAIAAVGFPLKTIDPGLDTLADVLVGEDGRAHAIRMVADSSFR